MQVKRNYKLQERDYRIAEWIDKLKAVQTDHVAQYFWGDKKYPKIQARKRLDAIYQNKNKARDLPDIKRDRIHINMQYTYFTCAKKQIEHQLQLANFMVKLKEIKGEIPSNWWSVEYKIEGIQADMILRINRDHYFFIESHNKRDKFDFEKYDKLYLSGRYNRYFKDLLGFVPKNYEFPKIIIITDKKLKLPKYTEVRFIQIKSDCIDIRKIFK